MIQQQKSPCTVEQMKAKALRNTTSTNTATNTTSEEIIYNLLQTEYQTSIKATSLARYICEHFDSLSISIQSRIINTHDFLMLFIPLIDEPPWTRRRTKSINNGNENGNGNTNDNTNANNDEINEVTVWEKYIDQEWKETPPCDLLQITQCEAQCWIAIFHLTCSSTNCREQYALNTYRKEQILRLRKFCNEYLMDQIPVLIDVTRYMDELSIMSVPDCNSTNTTRSGTGMNVLMEQVDQIRELILKEGDHDWEQVGMSQIESIYSKITDASDKDLRLIATIYNEENIHFGHGIDTTGSETAPVDLYTTPLELITICICNTNDNGGDKGKEEKDFENIFNLIPSRDDDSTTVQTPNGPFQRMKLTIVQTGDFNYLFSPSQNNGFKLQANLSFKNIVGVTQFIIDLVLPDKSKSTKKMEWIQLGKLEDKLVLQLGFKHNRNDENDSYELEQAFLARPAEE
jgi:hypothetical protein